MPMNPVRDEFIIAGDLTFHYLQWGKQGTPIICTHGLTANAFCFQAYADALATDHRVYAYDVRGRGDSDRPEHGYSVPIYADDLAEIIDTLELERPVVLGHSMGALVSVNFAARYPDKLSKLVLVDGGAPLPWKSPAEQPAWLNASVSRIGMSIPSYQEYAARLQQMPFIGPYWNEYFDSYFRHDVRQQADGSDVSMCSLEGIIEEGEHFDEADPKPHWAHIQVPTLMLRAGQGLFADNDQLLPQEAVAAAQLEIENFRYVNFPTLNHYTIILGSESRPAEEIRAFIDKE